MVSVGLGTGTPKDRDEVNRRDVCEWDGLVCVLDVIGVPSILRLTRKAAALARLLPTFPLSYTRNTVLRKWQSPPLLDCADCTPEAAKKRSVSRWACKNKRRTAQIESGQHPHQDCIEDNSWYRRSSLSLGVPVPRETSVLHGRRVDPSDLAFSLSSHRHSYMSSV